MAGAGDVKLGGMPEDAVVELLLQGVPAGRNVVVGPGDDCAVVHSPGSRELLLLKTDCVVEGVHYLREHEARRVGWKAVCRAVSDIAAMGGEPLHALISIFSPKDREISYWQEVYAGIARAAETFQFGVVGGETSRAGFAAISVTLVGRVESGRLVRRSGGRPDDLLFVTGTLGGSIKGRHLDFSPRVAEGRWIAARGFATAMMDVSDGLGADLPRLAAASGCAFEIDRQALPRSRGSTVAQALSDGEDYELLFAVPGHLAARLERGWAAEFPKVKLTRIGRLRAPGAPSTELPLGFDHFFSCQPGREKAS